MNRPHNAALGAAGLAVAGLVTAACGTSSPKAANTVTVTVTPSAPASSTSAASQPSPSTTSTSSAVAGCLTRYLNGSTGLSQGTAGSIYVVIRFKNLDNVPCTLYGFPGVALAAGTPVTDVGQPSVESSTTPRELVTLQPGGYANATLQVVDAGNYSPADCKPVKTTWLEVIPPNQEVPLNIPYSSQACKGPQKLLTVTAVRPGNGG
jgi:Protein of unknown function (DUF4232)